MINIWAVEGDEIVRGPSEKRFLLGKCLVDLSPLQKVPTLEGWFHIWNRQHQLVGQLRVVIRAKYLPLVPADMLDEETKHSPLPKKEPPNPFNNYVKSTKLAC